MSLNSLESLSLIDIQVSKNDKKEILNLLSEKKIKNLTLYGFDCALNTEIRSSLLELLSNDYYERLNIYALDFPGPYSDLLDICENREKPLTICFNCNFSSQQVPLMSTMLPMNVSEILRVEFLEHLEIEGFSEDLELIEHGSLDIDQDNRNTTVKKLSFIKCVISETFLEFFLESMQGCFELNFYGGTFILGDNNVPLENDRIEILRIHNSLVTEEDDIVSCLSLDFTSLRALELINTNCSVDDIDFILEGNFGLKNIVLLDNAMMENKAAYLAHKLMETLQLNPFIASIEVRFIDIDRFKDFADEIMDYSTDNGSLLSDYIYSLDREQKLFILTS